MSDVLERLLEHSVILSNAFSILPGTPLVFGLLNAKQAVKDDALLLQVTFPKHQTFFGFFYVLFLEKFLTFQFASQQTNPSKFLFGPAITADYQNINLNFS
jgi:hypothetical protein